MTAAFNEAVQVHQYALATWGEDDPRTLGALHLVMLLAPPEIFDAIEEMAQATFH